MAIPLGGASAICHAFEAILKARLADQLALWVAEINTNFSKSYSFSAPDTTLGYSLSRYRPTRHYPGVQIFPMRGDDLREYTGQNARQQRVSEIVISLSLSHPDPYQLETYAQALRDSARVVIERHWRAYSAKTGLIDVKYRSEESSSSLREALRSEGLALRGRETLRGGSGSGVEANYEQVDLIATCLHHFPEEILFTA